MYERTRFQQNLEKIMLERDITARELSDMAGVHVNTIRNYFSAYRPQDVQARNLAKIADALGMTMDELYRGDLNK